MTNEDFQSKLTVIGQQIDTRSPEKKEELEYDFLFQIISPQRSVDLKKALAKVKKLTGHDRVSSGTGNDVLVVLLTYREIFLSYVPEDQRKPVIFICEEKPIHGSKSYFYFVFEPTLNLTHRVMQTLQMPFKGGKPFFSLYVSTLAFDQDNIPSLNDSSKIIPIKK